MFGFIPIGNGRYDRCLNPKANPDNWEYKYAGAGGNHYTFRIPSTKSLVNGKPVKSNTIHFCDFARVGTTLWPWNCTKAGLWFEDK